MPKYPDISDILTSKAEGRRELAARPFGEKLDILEAMRVRLAPIRKARGARMGGQEAALALENRDELLRAFETLGSIVGPRRGPNRRTKDEKEWYCLRWYLLTLASQGLLHYPMRIEKSERPDFMVADTARGVFGIEVTEATEQDWQRELTETAAVEGEDAAKGILRSKTVFAGHKPEIFWSTAIVDAIEKKSQSLASPHYQARTCDLLVYVSTRASPVVDLDRALGMLLGEISFRAHAWNARGRLGRVTVLASRRIIHDLLANPCVFDAATA